MKISDVEIRRVQDDERVLAYVTLIFDDSFVVHDVKVIKGDKIWEVPKSLNHLGHPSLN